MNLSAEAADRKYVSIRATETGDLEAILQLLDCAFAPSKFESGLVKALLVRGRNIHHWILEKDREVMAYVCYSRAYRDREPIGWHLAPVAVRPERQRKGWGGDLIRYTLAQAPISDSAVFALGDPAYYARFGFSRDHEVCCPYDPVSEHFMALRYAGEGRFTIRYESEFDASDNVQGSKFAIRGEP